MKPNKTPYEIRLEILQLAYEILEFQHRTSSEIVDGVPVSKSYFTTEEVILEAEKLNTFVSRQL